MPVEVELSDHRPHLVGRRRKLDRFGDGLQFRVRRREIRKHLHAGLRRAGRAALQELAIVVDEPGEQDVDRVRVDRAAASRLVRPAVDRALLDLEVAFVGDRLGHIEQQKIVEEDIRVGGERFRRPIGLAVAHVPVGEAVLQALQEQRLQLLGDRERRLLIPQVAYVVYPEQPGIVEPYVRLLGAPDPVDACDWMSDAAGRLRDGDGLGDRAEQRALRGIEHAARVELDDDAEHVVVLQQIGNLLERRGDPGEVERVGTQPGEHADIALRRRRSLLVVHRERQLATARQCADAALDHVPRGIALQDLEPEAEADLVVRGLKLRGIADAGNGHPANGDRVSR